MQPTPHETEDFTAYSRLADQLIEKATKEDLADLARILALNIGWYHQRYGDVPQEDLLRLVSSETLQEEGKRLLLHGMQNLVSALAQVMGGDGDGRGGIQALALQYAINANSTHSHLIRISINRQPAYARHLYSIRSLRSV